MLQITSEFKNRVITALLEIRKNYEGSDTQFAKKWKLSPSVYNRLKKGEREGLIRDAQWLNMGRELNITMNERTWNAVRTEVFNQIEEEVTFCKRYSKAMIFVDECEIGKTFAATHLARTLKNCFYIDASQAKTRQLFVRTLAKILGLDNTGRYCDVKANIKYYLRMITEPIVIIDEPGDIDYSTWLEIKEFWNGTEGVCGWYMIGADGLRDKMERGIANKKVGFRELFSRFSSKYSSVVPTDRQDKYTFYKKLVTDVIAANIKSKDLLGGIVKKCLVTDEHGNYGGLRRAESLLLLNAEA